MVEGSGRLSKEMSSDQTIRPPIVWASVPRYLGSSREANLQHDAANKALRTGNVELACAC